jgi:hypothetical protein
MSMTLQEAEQQLRRVVSFKAHTAARAEYGVITAVGHYGVRVLFTGDRFAKLCDPTQLTSIPESWARTHHRDPLDHYTVVMAERQEEQA